MRKTEKKRGGGKRMGSGGGGELHVLQQTSDHLTTGGERTPREERGKMGGGPEGGVGRGGGKRGASERGEQERRRRPPPSCLFPPPPPFPPRPTHLREPPSSPFPFPLLLPPSKPSQPPRSPLHGVSDGRHTPFPHPAPLHPHVRCGSLLLLDRFPRCLWPPRLPYGAGGDRGSGRHTRRAIAAHGAPPRCIPVLPRPLRLLCRWLGGQAERPLREATVRSGAASVWVANPAMPAYVGPQCDTPSSIIT